MVVLHLLFFLIFYFTQITRSEKLPPPEYVSAVCDKPDCSRKLIKTKVYVEDNLWYRFGTQPHVDADNPIPEIARQLEWLFDKFVNHHLGNLDNGGFKIEWDIADIVKLNRSDVVPADTYIDRLNNNKTMQADPKDIFSHTFTFQEAVEKLPDRSDFDLRVLFILHRSFDEDRPLATAEETCICNPNWFGCVAIFSLRFWDNWAFDQSVFTHEIGHTLGMDLHDDTFYTHNPGNMLLMWSGVGFHADIWSPEAQRRIKNQDNSCLREETAADLLKELLY